MKKKAYWIGGSLAVLTAGLIATSLNTSGEDKTRQNTSAQSSKRAQQSLGSPTSQAPLPAEAAKHSTQLASHPAGCACGAHGATQTSETNRPAPILWDKELRQTLLNHSKGQNIKFALPGGAIASGTVDGTTDKDGRRLSIQGTLSTPKAGRFLFTEQTLPGGAGDMFGAVYFENSEVAYSVEPGANGIPELKETHVDQVICQGYNIPEAIPQNELWEVEEIPADHPDLIDIPSYQNGVIPLSSFPESNAVVYLDFDGEEGPHAGWNNVDAASFNLSNAQIKDLWARTAEEFAPFNINVTTDLQVYLDAPENSRQRCIITPTTAVYSGSAGGVAYVNGFNSSGDTPCWCFYSGNAGALVIAHEVGHTLGLSHDGTTSQDYYGGHDTIPGSWGPIMGAPYGSSITHWSKGEYATANRTQDDLEIIASKNNVALRNDDHGATLATATALEISADDSVANGGIIETDADFDAFKFTLTDSGSVSLTVSPASPGPNLDILAEILDSTGTVITSDNPDASLAASVSATLDAGEYFLRVTGEGFGDVQGAGFSSYGSLGFYKVSGTAPNAIQPDRFSIAENSVNDSPIGTVIPRNTHVDPIVYAISSGNSIGAFAIDPATGALTVADSTQFDYEALSTYYEDPATMELFVTITNAAVPALDETVRVVVTVTDVNEAPSLTIASSITALEHTAVGFEMLQATFTDEDHYQTAPTWSITSGNTGNMFAIDPHSGLLTIAGNLDASVTASYNLDITVTDNGTPALSDTGTITINVIDIVEGYVPGSITQEFYEGISGNSLSGLTSSPKFPIDPDAITTLSSLSNNSYADNYGSVIRGYLIPPTTGDYTFWLAGDDEADMRLSTDADPVNASVIANVANATSINNWSAQSNQQSATIALTAGQPYYLEIRHKEGVGGDHISAAWQGPGISQEIIPAAFLAPHDFNYAPRVLNATLTIQDDIYNGHSVASVSTADFNSADTHSGFTITSGNESGTFAIDADTGVISVLDNSQIEAGNSYTLVIDASDSATPSLTGSGTITINVVSESSLVIGVIEHQMWTGISGTAVSSLTSHADYPESPDSRRDLTSFDIGQDIGSNYGSRIQAYLVAPTTGSYTFYLATDNEGVLYLSTDADSANKTEIASVSGWAPYNNWTKYPLQTSSAVTLTAGQKYYIEALQKESGGGDNLQVAWTGPDFASITVIDGAYLEKFNTDPAPTWDAAPYAFAADNNSANGTAIGTVSATDSSSDTLVYNIIAGNESNAYAINPLTGEITIANRFGMASGDNILTIGVQDNAAIYNESTTDVTITVTGNNPPIVTETTFQIQENSGASIAVGTVAFTDLGTETWTYSIDSGNEDGFFAIDPYSGTITTTASVDLNHEQKGSHPLLVRVTDSNSFYDVGIITIVVTDVNESPSPANATVSVDENLSSGAAVGTVASNDPDQGDSLSYAIIAGNTNGTFTIDNNGNITTLSTLDYEALSSYTLTVEVTDSTLLSASATVTVNVNDIYEAPVVENDSLTVLKSATSGVIDVLANDQINANSGILAGFKRQALNYNAGTSGTPSSPTLSGWSLSETEDNDVTTGDITAGGSVNDNGSGLDAWIVTDNSTVGGDWAQYSAAPSAADRTTANANGWILETKMRFIDDFGSGISTMIQYGNGSKRFLVFFQLNGNGDLTAEMRGGGSRTTTLTTGGTGTQDFHDIAIAYNPATARASFIVDGVRKDGGNWTGQNSNIQKVVWGNGSSGNKGSAAFHDISWSLFEQTTTLTSGAVASISGDEVTFTPNGGYDHLLNGQQAEEVLNYAVIEANGTVSFANLTITIEGEGIVDADSDEIDDAWEMANFTNLTTADGTSDSDKDGQKDKDEYLAGTDPNLASDLLKTTAISATGNDTTVKWTSKPGKTYRLEYSYDLANWYTAESGIAGTGSELIRVHNDSAAKTFYRAVVE